jgi:transcriptional regulator with XRE-family HTH domain
MEHIGEKIRKIRYLKGLSQEYLATKCGISQNSLSKIELGETKLSIERLTQIANILELTPEEILTFDDKIIFNNNNTLHDQSKLINISYGQDEMNMMYKEQILLLKEQCELYKSILLKNNLL